MSHATRQNVYEESDEQEDASQVVPPVPSGANGPAEEQLVPQAVPADENMPKHAPSSDDAATPRPAAAGLAAPVGEPRITASPTTSEFDQAGFFPAAADRTRKFPGTPSDRVAEEERRDTRAAAMHEKEPAPAPKPKQAHIGAREKRKQAEAVIKPTKRSETTGGSILASFKFPPYNSGITSTQQHSIPRGTADPAPSAPATAVRAIQPEAPHANHLGRPSNQGHAQPTRAPSPHSGRFTRGASNSYTLARLSESQKEAALQQQALARRSTSQRGPSPSRAESSAMGATRRTSFPALQNDAFMPPRPVKREPTSPFIIPKLPDDYYVSEDDPYASPSEEKARRELHRKKVAARAEKRQRDFEEYGFTEMPAPAQFPTLNLDAMAIDDDDDSDSDSDDLAPSNLANGGVAINNPQPTEDQLAATIAMHRALANARIRVTRAGTRGPVNGLGRNQYWMHACPDQRRAILQARGHRVLARALGIIGHPEIDPRDPAMLAFLNKTIRDMFGDDSRAFATRIVSPVGANPGEEVAPGVFAITGLTEDQADFLNGMEWLLAGALQLEIHDVDEIASDHINTWSGAMVTRSRFRRGLIPQLISNANVQAVAADHAAQNDMTAGNAMVLIITSLRIDFFDVALPRTPGVVTRQFVVNGGSFLSTDNRRRLREATADIFVDTHLHGRAEVWHGWNCIVCNSITHPTGMCPSRILDGWAEAADELVRRLKEKRSKRRDDDNDKGKPRGDDSKRGGHGGGRGGRGAGGAGGSTSQHGRKLGI
ncbi:hypothetical protein AURDEDRAFT_168696 [Auricularia subglabra TFB-10046 SS5]|nr:hypothetical protein AURDEDRAFT_168696 [Auricularia subglabra TFB-10046 SS5]